MSSYEALNQRWLCRDRQALHQNMELDATLGDAVIGEAEFYGLSKHPERDWVTRVS